MCAIATKLSVSATCRQRGRILLQSACRKRGCGQTAEQVPTAVTATSGCGDTSNVTWGSEATACSAPCNLLTAERSSSRMTERGGCGGGGRREERYSMVSDPPR
jgi:hypothetical protein